VWLAYRRQGNQCRRVARSAASAQTKTGERDDQGRRRRESRVPKEIEYLVAGEEADSMLHRARAIGVQL